jgi:hypothetical protein
MMWHAGGMVGGKTLVQAAAKLDGKSVIQLKPSGQPAGNVLPSRSWVLDLLDEYMNGDGK